MNNGNVSAAAANGAQPPKLKIAVLGIGNAGVAVVELVGARCIDSVELAAIDLDPHSLAASSAATKILLENKSPSAAGTGGDPARARQVVEHDLDRFKPLFEGRSAVFLVAGLGAGA